MKATFFTLVAILIAISSQSLETGNAIRNESAQEGGVAADGEAVEGETTAAQSESKGMRLLLVNSTDAAIQFNACDRALFIVLEALDADGNWRPVQHFPTMFCGNSFHRVSLDANEFWSLPQPLYEGEFQTKLRFALVGWEQGGQEQTYLFSNEFDGSINPGQFESIGS